MYLEIGVSNEIKRVLDSVTKEQYRALVVKQNEEDPSKRYTSYKAPKNIPNVKLEF